ncbi:MerR family transcriptional regulator [Nocardia asteroides]|uniref:MerR family transcriptional regulator n=1 Tax=Nocardia asteroides TaxID=1824 RepID=UPI001E37F0AB|nr:MerR family transcriptional regulator [Nocardia asteroides]UGT56611.1 MerR family transcriptional regulator [Nocardia asteroides]
MRIGELSTRTGASVRSLRYYEEQGLLTSARSSSGQRHYTAEHVDRVHLLRRLYAAGLSSRTILQLVVCVDAPSEENSDAAYERMGHERDRLTEHIAELARARDALDELMDVNRAHHARVTAESRADAVMRARCDATRLAETG